MGCCFTFGCQQGSLLWVARNDMCSFPSPGAPQALCRDARTVPAGGAVEMEIAHQLRELARQESGLEQYAIAQFAAALEVRVRVPHRAVPSLAPTQFASKQTYNPIQPYIPRPARLQVVPRTIAENSGLDATAAVAALAAAHAAGQPRAGLDVETGASADLAEAGIVDLFATKWWALKLAAEAVCTVLRVDQIIMAKQAGGPKPRAGGDMDED